MNKLTRDDDFEMRREHLKNLNDEELKAYFWELAEKIVNPLLELAKKNTTPAIERSVLLRMGFSSLEAKILVEKVIDHNLISKGAGHVVYIAAKLSSTDLRTAGTNLINDQGWNELLEYFEVKK